MEAWVEGGVSLSKFSLEKLKQRMDGMKHMYFPQVVWKAVSLCVCGNSKKVQKGGQLCVCFIVSR